MALLNLILLILAFLCFLAAAFGFPFTGRVQLGWVGAALVTLTFVLSNWPR